RTLYNRLLSGVSLDGKGFFYPNPLESNGQHERSPWFGVACCPGNITRFLPSMPGYIYARRGDSVYVNLFADTSAEPVTLTVNDRPVAVTVDQGYAVVTRDWAAGDRVLLHLPMPVRRVRAADPVAADRGRIALQRGPIVYAAEWPDNPQGHVRNLLLKDGAPLAAEFRPGLLNGVE